MYTCAGGGVDYETPDPTITFAPNSMSASFRFVPKCDLVTEGNENVMLTISVRPQDQDLITTRDPSTTNVIIIGEKDVLINVAYYGIMVYGMV